MTKEDLIIICDGISEATSPSFSDRRKGEMAVTLSNVDLDSTVDKLIECVGCEYFFDKISEDEMVIYLEGKGYKFEL